MDYSGHCNFKTLSCQRSSSDHGGNGRTGSHLQTAQQWTKSDRGDCQAIKKESANSLVGAGSSQVFNRVSKYLKRQTTKVVVEDPARKGNLNVVVGEFDLRLMTADSIGLDSSLRRFPEVCDARGVSQLDASFRSPLASDVPALFISGTLDVRTPLSNAEETPERFFKQHAGGR